MPAPNEYSQLAGVLQVWAKMLAGQLNPAGSWTFLNDWDCVNVQIGTNDRISTSAIRQMRDKILRAEPGAIDPIIWQDALFCIAHRPAPPNQSTTTVIFEGTPSSLGRQISGTPGASSDSGELMLQASAVMWADAPESQIYGRYMPMIRNTDGGQGQVILDPSLPCVFNSGGKPNRSVRTAKDTTNVAINLFQSAHQLDTHYFTADDGWDFYPFSGNASTRKARFWTYGSAIAYVLHRYFYNAGQPMASVIRNNVVMWAGVPIGSSSLPTAGERRYPDSDTPWGAVIGADRNNPIFKAEAYGERYEGDNTPLPTTVPFDPTPTRLLTAKINDLSIEGMNVIEALGVLFRAAGMGMWIDSFVKFTGVGAPPPNQLEQVVRTWTPGGKMADASVGIGEILYPRLQAHGTSSQQSFGLARTPADIFATNTVESLENSADYSKIVNAPIIVRAPTLYEITAQLRPGWRPLHHIDFGFFDNVDPAANVVDPAQGNNDPVTTNELDCAIADATRALVAWATNPEDVYQTYPSGPLTRVKALAKRLAAKGDAGSEFYDIGRKWIIPTDLSYPTPIYARANNILGIPWFYKKYAPADFSQLTDGSPQAENWITEVIPGSELWPTRRMEFLPCLTCDSSGKSIGMKVDLSFDHGDTWHPYTSFRVLPDELGIYLTFENAFEVENPKLYSQNNPTQNYKAHGNLYLAYLSHNLRVRITATIAAPGTGVVSIPSPLVGLAQRCRAYDRRNKYNKTELRSRFKTRVTDDLTLLATFNATTMDADKKLFYYKAQDDSVPMLTEINRTQAVLGQTAQSGMWITPWIETNDRPGMAVPYLEEGSGPLTRHIDYRTIVGSKTLCAHVAGMIFNFARGGWRTTYLLDDWRSLSEDVRG